MNLSKIISETLQTKATGFIKGFNELKSAVTEDDNKALYRQYKSFTGLLPYSEFLDDEEMILLEDHVSVAAAWDLDPIATEGMESSDILSIETQLANQIGGPILERPLKDGQYVLSCFTYDEPTLEQELKRLSDAIVPRWKGTRLAEEYLQSTGLMLNGMCSDEGLFKETLGSGVSSDENMKPFRGGNRKRILICYRRVNLKDRKGKASKRNAEIEAMKRIRSNIEAILGSFTSSTRLNRDSFYEFVTRLINPFPAGSNGINQLLKDNPCPSRELASVDGDYCASMLHSTVTTNGNTGVVEFDGCPARFLQVERLNAIPAPGALTAEKEGFRGDIETVFDSLPPRSVFVEHITFCDADETKEYIDGLEKRTQHNNEEAELTNQQCKDVKGEFSKSRRSLYKTDLGVYLFAQTERVLEQQTEKVKVLLTNKLGLRAISPENNLFPIESFIRNLPCKYDPVLDNRRKRGKYCWFDHSIRLMPLLGRSKGFISRKKAVCMPFFNRNGEIIHFNPLDYEGNAHAVLLGPSGMGKSATLNKMIVELLLFKDARIYIAEAGESFDPVMDFLEAEGMDVQRINIGVGSNGRPVAPLAYAKHARNDALEQLIETSTQEDTETALERMRAVLCNAKLPTDKLEASIAAAKERIAQRKLEQQSPDENKAHSSKDDEKKDYLGECAMIAELLITGGDEKEKALFNKQDQAMTNEAISHAANIADAQGDEVVLPSHIAKVFNIMSDIYHDERELSKRLRYMADGVKIYTTGVRGGIFNRQCEPFKKCDCLHIELGLAQREENGDMLALAYISLMNMINDVAEAKSRMEDARPIYVITDEAHLILKDKRIAPIAVKIVRMWRKYGAWFLAATQDFLSFTGESRSILGVGEYYFAIKPPADDLEILLEVSKIKKGSIQEKMIDGARTEQRKYTEMCIINKARKSCNLVRIVQCSFTLALAGTDDAEKVERAEIGRQYNLRPAGATLIQAAKIDQMRGLINEQQLNKVIQRISEEAKYKKAA